MVTSSETLITLETGFWQSMIDQDTDAALKLLHEPALMVGSHGSIKFDHAGYRKMAEQGSMIVIAFKLTDIDVIFPNKTTAILTYRVNQTVASRDSRKTMVQEMFDTSTWIHSGKDWQCVMHTEVEVATNPIKH